MPKPKRLFYTLPVRLREDDRVHLETLANAWGVSLAEATRLAIESVHSRFQDERDETRFELIMSEQKTATDSINQSRLRLEQFFSFFGEFERRMYARIDDKVIAKLDEFEPVVSDIFVRLQAMVRCMKIRPEIETEIQNILQGK